MSSLQPWHLCFCVLLVLDWAFGFNIETREPIVKKSNQPNSYFGFSVALHKSKTLSNIKDNWILVGAPLGQNLQPGSNQSGALFKCPISTLPDDCEQVITDGRRLDSFDYGDDEDNGDNGLTPPGIDEIKTGQWLGVSVKSQKPGGIVIVCAHRYIQSPDLSKYHYGQGLCYLLDEYLNVNQSLQYCKGRPVEKHHQQYGLCQIGTSAGFVDPNFSVVGAPGPYTWRGTLFAQVVGGDYLVVDKTVYKGPLNDNPKPIDKYSYLGMSVGGGRFFSPKKYTFFSGAPRGELVGLVYLFDKHSQQEELDIVTIIRGDQFASGFGYEAAAVDVNADGYDDLLVGAPFFYNDGIGGAVHIYYNVKKCNNISSDCKADRILEGKSRSRFGLSIAGLGDINKDGYNDVAIGAPYEHDEGAVYIYLGSKDGLQTEPSQIIKVKNHKTFGYSLSGGLDMDENGYPDLLVGAFESDMVALFKTRPIIDIKIKIQGDELRNINASRKGCASDPKNVNNTCFSFKSCFTIMGFSKKQDKFRVISNIKEEKKIVSRIWFRDPNHPDTRKSERERTIVVSSSTKEYCEVETVYIKDTISDILSPIKFKVQYTLENNKVDTPILNKTSIKDFEATFQKDCGTDDECKSYLILDVGTNLTQNNDGAYMVNMINEEFVLEVNISNTGESAYETKLFVSHPSALSYIALKTDNKQSIHVKCSSLNHTISCELGNPFNNKQVANLKLRFETVKTTKEQILNINITVNSTSIELSNKTSATVVAILQKIAEFSLEGKATSNLFYGGPVKGEAAMKQVQDIGARVKHIYQIDNTGQWVLPSIHVVIKWPYQVEPGKSNRQGKWLLYLESLPVVSGLTANGSCYVSDKSVINPLNLTLSDDAIDEPENLTMPDEFNHFSVNDTQKTRRKREAEYVVPAHITERAGKKRKVVTLDCNKGTAYCINIECQISNLLTGNQAFIYIKSRIWNSTLVEDYSNVDWVIIKSTAEMRVLDSFNISENSTREFSAQTVLYPMVVQTDSNLNWYIIGGSILAGLLLLIILVIILYKCGFFKRKRVSKDPTLSGNLHLKDENDKLLKK